MKRVSFNKSTAPIMSPVLTLTQLLQNGCASPANQIQSPPDLPPSAFSLPPKQSAPVKVPKRVGVGKGGVRRHRKHLRDNIQGITKPAIRRLARRGGVKRISNDVYEETRRALYAFLEKIIGTAITYTDYGRRKTVTAMDVVNALKKHGKTLYGFGG